MSTDDRKRALLARLDAIAASLARRPYALALIGVGSAGAHLERMDEFSDLDFFAIVEREQQEATIANLDWLQEAAPIAFSFRNTRHGHKVLFDDGIYAEFAVFYPEEFATMPFEGGRVVWQRDPFVLPAAQGTTQAVERPSVEFLLGEIVTNLYVGLLRLRRGEVLAAQRLIQVHAVDRILDLQALGEIPSGADPFDRTRRAERLYPALALTLGRFVQGYKRSPESALAILGYLEERFEISPVMARSIRRLAAEARAQRLAPELPPDISRP